MADITVMKAACLCGKSNFTTSVATSALPLPTYLCQCNHCRHMSGALYYAAMPWPGPLPNTTTLTSYPFSDNVQAYFCSTCGAHMFWHNHQQNFLDVTTGVLDNPEKYVKVVAHQFVNSTKDGGFSDWLPVINETQPLPRWGGNHDKSELLPRGWKVPSNSEDLSKDKQEPKLRVQCFCEGVNFRITRPDELSSQLSTRVARVVLPEMAAMESAKELPVDGRYLAQTCACTSCRLASGIELFQWAYITTANIKLPNGDPFRLVFGTLKAYASSTGKTRCFCGRCGATVFWYSNERPQLVDVAVGLLDAVSGARAEVWLNWNTESVINVEDATHRSFAQALQVGLRAWGKSENQ